MIIKLTFKIQNKKLKAIRQCHNKINLTLTKKHKTRQVITTRHPLRYTRTISRAKKRLVTARSSVSGGPFVSRRFLTAGGHAQPPLPWTRERMLAGALFLSPLSHMASVRRPQQQPPCIFSCFLDQIGVHNGCFVIKFP